MATPNCGDEPAGRWRPRTRAAGFILAACLAGTAVSADEKTSFADRARQTYEDRHRHYATNATDPAAAWRLAQACFEWAEFATNNDRRAALAQEGIAASRQVIAVCSNLPPAHYYLAMNLGQLARTKTLGALAIVPEIERAFLRALELDPHFDYAGPDRCLGLLYRDAPGWPASIGSKSKARQHLRRAVELHPEYPENGLNWIETCLRWGDHAEAARQAEALAQALPRARMQFAGPDWAEDWEDWDRRWNAIRLDTGEPSRTNAHRRQAR